MTKDDIIKLAQKAGMPMAWISDSGVLKWTDLERFSHLVAEHEREECAKLAEKTICDVHIFTGVSIYGTRAAKAIRARVNT
jgi:hypothetical protein